jgi:amino acid adenylation domain-containing protein
VSDRATPRLDDARGRLLELTLKRRGVARPERTTGALPEVRPKPDDRFEPFPLTPIQQAYWLGRQRLFALGGVGANGYVEIDGAGLDVARLRRAWHRLVERHDMLRAVITDDGRQRVQPDAPPAPLPVFDLRSLDDEPAGRGCRAIRRLLSHECVPIDGWPFVRLRVTLLPTGRQRLHVGVDALVVDAWSLVVLVKELGRLYDDSTAVLPALDLTFRDYVLAERRIEGGEARERSRRYWREKADSFPPAPELPLARDPEALDRPRFVRRSATLPSERWKRLRERATAGGLTPSGAIAAAFADVLAAWCATPRFTLNLTLFQRLPLHPGVPHLVGDFTSVFPLAVDARAGASFEERAHALQEQLWKALDHRFADGVEVLREIAARSGPRDGRPAGMPVVLTSTLGQGGPEASVATVPESLGEVGWGITQTPQVWLDHQLYEERGALTFNWDAVEDLFPPGLLTDMFSAYCGLLDRLSGEPEAWRRERLDLVPAWQLAERAAANDTTAPISGDLLFSGFVRQAERAPDAPAVITPDRTLAYRELDRRARRVAARLVATGAKPGDPVAIVMDKGWEEAVAALGVLFAGAAYLPIDAALPRSRIEAILRSSGASHALVQPWTAESVPASVGTVLEVGAEEPGGAAPPPSAPAVDPGALAYVIYTSGSTGMPKGVAIDHRGAVNTLVDIGRRFRVGPEDRVLALSRLSFDLSVFDLFGVWAAGGTTVLPAADRLRDPSHWLAVAGEHRVTIWNSVPALLEMLVHHLGAGPAPELARLRLALLSGDWIPLALPDRVREVRPAVSVVSLGGATETSIWSVFHPIEHIDPRWTSIPYGRPLTNQTLHVLDDTMEPRPIWVPGPLFIGGAGQALGYWRDEERTRAAFVTHPVSGERLYRTGDVARYLPGGDLELLGREDSQVKIRGHRIELGEIESVLALHPAVESAAVAAVGPARGRRRLVGFVVLARSADPPTTAPEPPSIDTPIERARFKLRHPSRRIDVDGPAIALRAAPSPDEDDLAPWVRRRTFRAFENGTVARERLEDLLAPLREVAIDGLALGKRRYGSAGGLYPVQTYVWVRDERVEGVPGGAYYHDPVEHRLLALPAGDGELGADLVDGVNRPALDSSAFCLFLVAEMAAVEPMYDDLARHYAILEAGLVTQLLETEAAEIGLGLCQVGRVDDDRVRRRLDLGPTQVLLHTLLGGPVAARRRTVAGLIEDSRQATELLGLLEEADRGTSAPPPASSPERTDRTPDEAATRAALLDHVAARLPEALVPTHLRVIDRIPLTVNGKIDRRALAGLAEAEPALGAPSPPPRTELERSIAALWSRVLDVDSPGRDESFFELGGSSVQMVQVHRQLQEHLGREISVLELFQHPTVALLASHLDPHGASTEPEKEDEDRGEAVRRGADRLRQQLRLRRGTTRESGSDE